MVDKLLRNISQLIFLIYAPLKMRKFLRKGIFKYNNTATTLYPINYRENNISLPMIFADVSGYKNIFKEFFTHLYFYCNYLSKNVFNGDYMIISSSMKEFKFFNFTESLLLTYFSDDNKLVFIHNERKEWSKWIKTIPTTIDIKRKSIIEPLISSKSFAVDAAFSTLKHDYYYYYLKNSSYDKNSFYKINLEWLEEFCSFLPNSKNIYSEIVELIKDQRVPIYRTHGDLWRSNILFDGNSFFYIDFEHTGNRVFYYDIFTFVFSEAFLLQDRNLLEKYYTGEMDSYLEKLSSIFNFQYNRAKKNSYMLLFIFELFNERWRNTNNAYLALSAYKIIKNNNIK